MSNRLTILRGGAVHLSTGEGVGTHAAHAWKLVVGLDADVVVEVEGRRFEAPAVLVRPGVVQAMGSAGTLAAFFAEPGSTNAPFPVGAERLDVFSGRALEALRRIGRDLALGRATDDGSRLGEAFRLAIPRAPSRVDRRVEVALAWLAAESGARVDEVAAAQRLSATRLRHLVHDSTGLSLRTHRLWHRTIDAIERVAAGQPLASAALDAGFADHAHFTRSFGRFFGRTPSSLVAPTTILAPYSATPASAATPRPERPGR